MYSLLKLIHIGSLVLWLGPALGSWLVLRYMQRQQGELSPATGLVYKVLGASVAVHLPSSFGEMGE